MGGKVKLTEVLHGRESGVVRPTVTWEGEVKCNQLLHGSKRHSVAQCYMGVRGEV